MYPDDIALMERIARCDQSALAELYQRYAPLVYSVAMRVLQNPASAEEVMQDTFVKVWREPQKWNPDMGRFINWIVTIARYTAIDRLRKERRQPPLSATALDDIPLHATSGTIDEVLMNDLQLVHRLMDQLPAAQVEVIQLAFWQGMTHAEISERLQVPLGTVKSRLQLGLRKLRDLAAEKAEQASKT